MPTSPSKKIKKGVDKLSPLCYNKEKRKAETKMSECEKSNCGYYYQLSDEDYPRCHWEDDGFPAPCEYDDEPADIDDDCGFDPYEGCYTYDC
jgi:hypothetical protein